MKEKKAKQQQDEAPVLKKLTIEGDSYLTTFNRKYENRQSWVKPDRKKVLSFIPGTVRQILVKEGEMVAAEQKILVLEAMKMMNTLYSPMAGKIKTILVKEGDCLPKGVVLMEFE
jgi:biotin carboxyl carrier protein